MTKNTHPSIAISDDVTLLIDEDESRVLCFDPMDIIFAQKYYELMLVFEDTMKEHQASLQTLLEDEAVDKRGLPLNTPQRVELLLETCAFIEANIDDLFGDGTSLMVFQGKKNLGKYTRFLEGVGPYVSDTREEKMQGYQVKPKSKKHKTSRKRH